MATINNDFYKNMKDTRVQKVQELIWHKEKVKESEYGGSIMYSHMKME
jgi:hypothetical protein